MTKLFPDNKRTLIIEPAGNLWGSERVLLDFLRAAVGGTWEIGVCCPPHTPILSPLTELPLQVFPNFRANLHLQGKKQRLGAVKNLLLTALRFKPKLIYVNQAGATRLALLVGRLLRIPVITHVRLVEDVAYIASLQATPQALPKVICISNYIRGLFPSDSAVSSQQLEILYDPYLQQYDIKSAGSENEAQRRPTFACVGRLAQIKGQHILLQAMAVLKQQNVAAQAVFIGAAGPGDAFASTLEKLTADLKLENEVEWLGFAPDVLAHTTKCSAQVIPSWNEPLGRVLFEAWDAGIMPIAWMGSGGAAEVIQASQGGLLYEQQDGQSLANALKLANAMSPEAKASMVEHGREWVRHHCNPINFSQRMFELWENAVKI